MIREEIYDVFDKNGKIKGKASWTKVHTKGLLHQVSASFIFDDEIRKRILLQKRSDDMDQDPGLWNHSAGGHIASGEVPKNAALREISEELFDGKEMPNIKISEVTTFINHDMPNNYEIFHLFEVFYNGPIYPQKEEVNQIKWVDFDFVKKDTEINPEKYTQSFKNTLKEYIKVKY